jgi:hypothetical protein
MAGEVAEAGAEVVNGPADGIGCADPRSTAPDAPHAETSRQPMMVVSTVRRAGGDGILPCCRHRVRNSTTAV